MSNITIPSYNQKNLIRNFVNFQDYNDKRSLNGKYAIAHLLIAKEPSKTKQILVKIKADVDTLTYTCANPIQGGRLYEIYCMINVLPDFTSEEWFSVSELEPSYRDSIIFVDDKLKVYKGWYFDGSFYTYNDWLIDDLKASKLFTQKSDQIEKIDRKKIKFWNTYYKVTFDV